MRFEILRYICICCETSAWIASHHILLVSIFTPWSGSTQLTSIHTQKSSVQKHLVLIYIPLLHNFKDNNKTTQYTTTYCANRSTPRWSETRVVKGSRSEWQALRMQSWMKNEYINWYQTAIFQMIQTKVAFNTTTQAVMHGSVCKATSNTCTWFQANSQSSWTTLLQWNIVLSVRSFAIYNYCIAGNIRQGNISPMQAPRFCRKYSLDLFLYSPGFGKIT